MSDDIGRAVGAETRAGWARPARAGAELTVKPVRPYSLYS
ncbi:hypothetical protein HMPREF0185_00155 [Brevundimonas diminuta 470-4]|nr:hypothetical protein HMPREF0185_00155 [Brevundimonas diminuta 470-4]